MYFSRRIDIVLLVLGIAGLFCLSPVGTGVAIVAAISIIGLPIALLLAAIPTIFVFLLLARLLYIVLSMLGLRFWPLSAFLALGILAIVPWFANGRLDLIATSLTGDDRSDMAGRPATVTLAVVRPGGFDAAATCDDLCQRALLNDAVPRIIMVRAKTPLAIPGDDLDGTMYRLEKRPTCPQFDLKDGVENLDIAGEDRKWGDKTPADLLRLRAAEGICLIEEKATLGQADAVLVIGQVRKGMSDFVAGLSPFADTISANRLSFYMREGGQLVERHRSTGVTYYRLLPLLAPSYVSGYGLELAPGFLRRAAYKGDARQFYPTPPLEPFLTNVLHFDLVLRDDRGAEATRQVIAAALDQPGAIDRAKIKVMADFLEDFQRRKDSTKTDAILALRIIGDRRIPVPRAAAAPVRKFADGDPDLAKQFAKNLFGRLFDIEPSEREDDPSYLGYTLAYLAAAIEALPDSAILPYRQHLERLARDPKARIQGYAALKKLSVFGADAVPTLIYLIDDAANYKSSKDFGDNAWQHPYLAGVQGLCRMEQAGRSAIPMIYERLDSGIVVKFASYWDMTINMLVSLGANPEEMWPLLQTKDRNHTRQRFDNEVKRAARKLDCSY